MQEKLNKSLQSFYEAHPYPHYPLIFRPKWQDGYMATSQFCQKICGSEPKKLRHNFLILGSGEILPYIIRKSTPSRKRVDAIDLSGRSLKRAQIRTLISMNRPRYFHTSIEDFLAQTPDKSYDHIDAYGVLHHASDPLYLVEEIARVLQPGGSLRLMVYNSQARDWIYHLQKALKLLKLDYTKDVNRAQEIVQRIGAHSPSIGEYLGYLGKHTLNNRARFSDTFLHVREARITIKKWFTAIEKSGLSIKGLFDRYEELDHLQNPMWKAPTAEQLEELSRERIFENNLELFISKECGANTKLVKAIRSIHSLLSKTKTAPSHWNRFSETRDLSPLIRQKIWVSLVNHMNGSQKQLDPRWLHKSLSVPAMARLARIGAILPTMIEPALREHALAPISGDRPRRKDFKKLPTRRFEIESFSFESTQQKKAFFARIEAAENCLRP